ncbi:MAG TPA: sulfatase-like hydrolase/transferase [Opitutus sp.]|nr:sulfatase-like hydrolase/transferase [Opitutus sp.]
MKKLLFAAFLCLACSIGVSSAAENATPPNIVLILIDDLGYGDIGPFGSTKNRTLALDRMAREGRKFTSYYSAPVCSPTRAQVLTGAYAQRVSIPLAVMPGQKHGLNPAENTVAELLKARRYATLCIGKWHLGYETEFFPTHHGFDPPGPNVRPAAHAD